MIFILLIYLFLGSKANTYCKKHILHLETAYVFNIWNWIINKGFWAFLLGWLTIPLAIIIWLFQRGKKPQN